MKKMHFSKYWNPTLKFILFLMLFISASQAVFSQTVTIKEELVSIKTYPFGDPNPTPSLTSKPFIYPYHTFDGYSSNGELRDWKVVTLENDYIKVMILPEVGGKIWGAIDKGTGADFIYKNDVIKFRNIAMRGPWTSGGIEFNFGYIGHTPSTATPVDYVTRKNDDGSVSCFVGNIDLPSRTQWRVEIRLSPNKSYFETKALYFNPTNSSKSYYNWMTGAAQAREGFEMIYPGNQALTHPGEPRLWPVNKDGIEQNFYENNDFGSHVSQHVVGVYEDFFGGYYHDEKRGFGHVAPYEQMPGQKVWLWALSRSGGIWEDLLTDTNGQYMEFQAGRMLNQFSPARLDNPITKAEFQPHSYDSWTEIWFPYNKIGGMVDASNKGVLNVKNVEGGIAIGLNSLVAGNAVIHITQNGKEVYSKTQGFLPNQVFMDTVSFEKSKDFEVTVEGFDLSYSSQPTENLKRDFVSPAKKDDTAGLLYHEGLELKRSRKFTKAIGLLLSAVELDPYHFGALNTLAEIYFQKGLYEMSLQYARQTLSLDTFDPTANFIAGNIYKAMNMNVDALESYGWAARSMEFRASSYLEMAGIYLLDKKYEKALSYLKKSLSYNTSNLSTRHLLAVVYRKMQNIDEARKVVLSILDTDPLNHTAGFELDLLNANGQTSFQESIRTELAYQAYLEMAMSYYNYGLSEEAYSILKSAPSHPMVSGWKAFIQQSNTMESQEFIDAMMVASPGFVFPYRSESIDMLEWIVSKTNNWKAKYYLGLNYWAKGRLDEAASMLKACGNEPDFAPFYVSRARLLKVQENNDELPDLKTALTLESSDWRNWNNLIDHHFTQKDYGTALKLVDKATKNFRGNYELALKLTEAYLYTGQYKKCIDRLKTLNILPFEGAGIGREIFEKAHLMHALDLIEGGKYDKAMQIIDMARTWPENLGVGKPYDPDLRFEDFLTAHCLKKLNKKNQKDYEQRVIDYTLTNNGRSGLQAIFGLNLLKLSDSEKSEAHVKTMEESGGVGNAKLKWVLAAYNNDKAEMEQLSKNLEHDLYFVITKKMLEL